MNVSRSELGELTGFILIGLFILLGFTISIFLMESIRMIVFIIQNKFSFKEFINLFKETIKEIYNGN